MELKKSKDADLETKRIVFGSVGLVMVSALVLMAFTMETATVDKKVAIAEEKKKKNEEDVYEMPPEQAPPPEQQESAPPPPTLEVVEVVEDDEEIEELDLTGFEEEQEITEEEEEEVEIEAEPIVDFAEVEPAFPGGEAEMAKFIRDNVVYPELSREMDEQGTVYVQFVVNSDGSIQDVVVLKGVSDLLDREAVRVVKMMPDWAPGEQAGKKIRVRYQIPIKFSIG